MEKAWLIFKDTIIMGLGLLAFTTGTYFSVQDIAKRLGQTDDHSSVLAHLNVTENLASIESQLLSNLTSLANSLVNTTTTTVSSLNMTTL